MNHQKLKTSLKRFAKIGKQLLNDKNITLLKIQEGFIKASQNKGKLTAVWEKMQLLFSLAKDYANGTYTNVSRAAIIAIIASLLYFISPLDVIPDFIAGLGLVDDAFIIGYVFNKVAKELEKYQAWKSKEQNIIYI